MITKERLDHIKLHPRPFGQRFFGALFLTPNFYSPFTRTRIRVEGMERIPRDRGAVLVMNHTDRYNYWPFQYEMWRQGVGYTATWVKGKYYENAAMGWFMDLMNNIPIPSRGYVVTKDFESAIGREPTKAEYGALKHLADGKIDRAAALAEGGKEIEKLLAGAWPDGDGDWVRSLDHRFARMMDRVVQINVEALASGLHLLIFPEGTRSRRLGAGHTGAAQIILHTNAPVIPIGCNGSDRCYPGNSPLSRGGEILYRVGEPLWPDRELAPFQISEPFTPYTAQAKRHEPTFRALTDLLMSRIDALLDPEYRATNTPHSPR